MPLSGNEWKIDSIIYTTVQNTGLDSRDTSR